jgi:hypothetical protein
MFDADVFLARCPWIQETDNATELVIAWATQGRTQLRRTEAGFDFETRATEIQTSLARLPIEVDRMLEVRLRPLETALTTKVAGVKGKVGEAMYETWAEDFERSWKTENTANVPHSGDYIHEHRETHHRVVVDVKNYTSSVKSCEIDKLWRDMEEQRTPLGMLVSVTSRVAKCRPDIDILYRNVDGARHAMVCVSNAASNRPLLYISLEILRLLPEHTPVDVGLTIQRLAGVVECVNAGERMISRLEKELGRVVAEYREDAMLNYSKITQTIGDVMRS